MDAEVLRDYLDWYKVNFSSIFTKHEDYKWESVQHFQSTYKPDKGNFPEVLKEGFKRSVNLLNSQYTYSLGMMLDITKFSQAHPDIQPSGLNLFYDLFEGITPDDRGETLLRKISSFRQQIRRYVRTHMPDKHQDYQDLHAVSVYLNHRYPDTFYMYRTAEFEAFNELIGNEYPYEWGADSNYLSYLDMCDGLNAILRREMELDEGFRLAVNKAVNSKEKKYYLDPEYRILTQDFIFSIKTYYKMDMTDRYAGQMKKKSLTTIVDEVRVENLKTTAHSIQVVSETPTPSKIDYVLRQKENSRLGAAGEQWVLAYEKKRLSDAGRKDLAKKVDWVAQMDDSKGYDILSFDVDGNELYIEVKTTNGGAKTPFYLSATEMAISGKFASKYRIYRVYDFLKAPKILIIVGDIGILNPQPTTYIVYTD